MKSIVVSAASLRMGGAVTIYNQFITHLGHEIGENRYFIFVNKVLPQPYIDGVRYYIIDIESRSRRNWFDNRGCKEILEREGFHPDVVISLQNTGIRSFAKDVQLVYYHQALPFFKIFWNPLKKDDRSKFLYKHFYLWFVKRSIGPKTEFVVQTQFIKDNLVKRLGIDQSRVHICFPDVELPSAGSIIGYSFPQDEISLIYPSLYSPHKSHGVLVKAIYELNKRCNQLASKTRLYFTVYKSEAPMLVALAQQYGVESMISFMGRLPYETTLSLYKSATALLFPSTIETLGLPLIEAASFGLPIIAADAEYSHEVLEGYEGVTYAKAHDANDWAIKIERLIVDPIDRPSAFSITGKAGWHEFFELI